MNFIHIINVRWYNATAWYAVNLSRLMHNAGHKVIVAGLPGSPPIKKAKEYGLEVFEADLNSSNPFIIIKNIYKINKLIKRVKPDSINCHRGEFFWYFAIKRLVNKVLGKNQWKLFRFRGDQRDPKGDVVNKFMHNRCADYIVCSGEVIAEKYKKIGITESKIKVIYGGVDREKFKFDNTGRKSVRKEFCIEENDTLVGIVGRLDYVKGHEILIRSIAYLIHEKGIKNIKLLIVGFATTMTENDVWQIIKRYNIENNAYISGFREDITACMSALDVGVVSSIDSETICRVAMELMSIGVPVVASDVGVLSEVVLRENIYTWNDYKTLGEKILNHSNDVKIFSDADFLSEYMEIIRCNETL